MGLFIGLLYLQTETNQIGVRNTFGVLFYFCSELTYSTIFGIQSYMPGDFPLVAREYNDGVYPVSAYYTAKVASYVFLYSLDGMVMVVLSYFLIGLYASADRFLLTILAALLIELCAASVGVAICSAAPSYAIAVSVTGPLLTVLSVTGGLMSAVDELPSWISWIQYASWFRYGYEALIINHMTAPRYDSIPCDQGNNQTCIRRGQDVIDTLSFSTHNFVGNQVIMFLYTCCVYCLGYGALVFRVIRSR